MNRRNFLKLAIYTSFIASLNLSANAFKIKLKKQSKMKLELQPLPYAMDALAPHISQETLEYHYGKHHQAYATNGSKLLENSKYANLDVIEIIKESAKDPNAAGIFNNVAQYWNHDFYWKSMKANGGGEPTGSLKEKIIADFGSFENFKDEFAKAGATQFGSGWAWLVLEDGKLKVTKTLNADNPFTKGQTPLLTMDVWEHAYYIDFRNARPKYIDTFLEHLVNWDFAQTQFDQA